MGKKVIRYRIFESNSSMSHSLIIMPKDQSKRWEEGNLYYYNYSWWNPFKDLPEDQQPIKGSLYTQEEVLEFLRKNGDEYNPEEWDDNVDDFIYEMCSDAFSGYERWHDSDWEEYGDEDYVTPNGEEIVVEWKCGRDG